VDREVEFARGGHLAECSVARNPKRAAWKASRRLLTLLTCPTRN
jgi:hypothetical protein